jgi:large subunit ribosomal protein L46
LREKSKAIFKISNAYPSPRSRFTEADLKGDMKSLYRALDKRLFLIVKKNRKEFAWQFPQGLIEEGETIRKVR